MYTPVHALSACSIAEKPESPCTRVHIFTFAPSISVQFGFCTILTGFDFSAQIRLSSGLTALCFPCYITSRTFASWQCGWLQCAWQRCDWLQKPHNLETQTGLNIKCECS